MSCRSLCLTLLALCLVAPVPANTGARMPVTVSGTRVRLIPPPGFTPSSQFPGFGQAATRSSIMVTEIPGPYQQVSAGFSMPAEMAKRGMAMLGKQHVTISGHKGLLVRVKQVAGAETFLKWMLVAGDERETLMVVAAFPAEREKALSSALRASVLSTTWSRGNPVPPTEGLNYSVGEAGGLKRTRRLGNSLLYSRAGVFPSTNVDEPVFVVAPSISGVEIPDREAFSRTRVQSTASVTDVAVSEVSAITVDGLPGYELTARGKDAKSGQTMVIYQTILFEGKTYYILQGLVSARSSTRFLPAFRQMARSFRRTRS